MTRPEPLTQAEKNSIAFQEIEKVVVRWRTNQVGSSDAMRRIDLLCQTVMPTMDRS